MKSKWLVLVCLLVTLSVPVGCAPTKAEVPAGYERMRILGGSLGGTSATAVTAFAVLFNKYYPEIEWSSCSATAATTPAYILNGTAKLGSAPVANYVDAYGFEKIPGSRLRSINLLYTPTQNFWLVREDKPWTDLTQVPRGTSLCAGTQGAKALLSETWANLCGLDKKHFNWLVMGKTEQADAWRTGKLDLALGDISGMAPYLRDMWTSPYRFKAMGLSPEQVAKAKAEQTFERLGLTAPAKTNLMELVPEAFKYEVFGTQAPNFLWCRDDFPEDIAYRMAKVIDERNADLAAVFPPMKATTPQLHIQWARPPADIHCGVARYYREKGYLK